MGIGSQPTPEEYWRGSASLNNKWKKEQNKPSRLTARTPPVAAHWLFQSRRRRTLTFVGNEDMKNSKNRDIVLIVVWLLIATGVYGSLMSRPGIHGAGSMIFAAIGGIFSATLAVGFMSRKSW